MTPGESPGESQGEEREGPGETLQAARLAMEISCREVAEALNLPIETVEAIEANDYERLPAPVFTRGYIRAYAKLLELDSDPVVARFPLGETETQTAEVAITPSANTLQALVRQNPRHLMGVAGALGLVLLIVLAVWLLPESDQAPEDSRPARSAEVVIADAAEDVADERVATAAEPAGPAPSTDAAAATSARVEPTVAAAPAAAPQPEADSVPDIEDVPASAVTVAPAIDSPSTEQPALNTPVGVRRITPTGSDRLLFQFTEDCWVEIKSATGASLYSDLSRAGRTLELVGLAPFRILLGYAPGVTMSFNDEAVALAPHTRNNVANLVLGQ